MSHVLGNLSKQRLSATDGRCYGRSMGNEIVLSGKFTAESNTLYIDSVNTHIREVYRIGTVVFN